MIFQAMRSAVVVSPHNRFTGSDRDLPWLKGKIADRHLRFSRSCGRWYWLDNDLTRRITDRDRARPTICEIDDSNRVRAFIGNISALTVARCGNPVRRSEEHTSELQSVR